jgi:glutamine amidotransferase
MSIVLIDYGSGNLRSAAKAFERAVAETGMASPVEVTGDAAALSKASHIVLPGVGAFGDCRAGLDALPGMAEALENEVRAKGKPFLGICVGMQLMAQRGLEHGTHEGLGWILGEVRALEPDDKMLKIPHMGWNQLDITHPHPVLDGIRSGAHFYFVHGYGMVCAEKEHILATTDYGGPVTAMVARDNLVGTQFHPETSQQAGLALIANFLRWQP